MAHPPLSTLLSLALACALSTTACKDSPSEPARPPATKAPAGKASEAAQKAAPIGAGAVVARGDGLWLVGVGGSKRKLVEAGVTLCKVDNRAQLVWFTAKAATAGRVELRVLDLRDGSGQTVSGPLPAPEELIVDYGKRGKLGGHDPVSFKLALRVALAASPPSLGAALGCDGDMEHQCFGDGGKRGPQHLVPALAKTYRALLTATKAQGKAKVLVTLATRGGERPLEAPTLKKKLPKVAVDATGCGAIPEECGKAKALPGGRYWLVVTENSRGDFYHETRQLYDPKTKQFVDLGKTPPARSAKPTAGATGIEGGWISPGGEALLTPDGQLVHLRKGTLFKGATRGCGWVGGGWRVSGPRG
jgi:hypothetical protein